MDARNFGSKRLTVHRPITLRRSSSECRRSVISAIHARVYAARYRRMIDTLAAQASGSASTIVRGLQRPV
jgi:hypothetical protein